jgi:putative Holliday junction resolvase
MTVPGKLMALDVGDATVGVAVSDALGIGANPIETIRRTTEAVDLARVLTLLKELSAVLIVIGLPRMLNNTIGIQAQKVQAFAEALGAVTDTPIVMWDERYSTSAAEKALIQSGLTRKRRKKVIDQVAAVFFLQGYLNHLAMGGQIEPIERPDPTDQPSPTDRTGPT